jgi:hypothetical protein
VEHRSECLSPRSLEGTRVRGVVSNPSYNAAEYTELANPILSLWQQRNFRKENMIDGLPPLLRNAEDLKSIILDLIYERMRLALQLASLFHTVSEEFFVKICRAKVVNLHNRPLFDGEFAQNDAGVTLKHDAHIHGILTRLKMHSCLQLTADYIDWYERADYDRQDIQKDMVACSLAITLVHEHARAVWQTRGHAI